MVRGLAKNHIPFFPRWPRDQSGAVRLVFRSMVAISAVRGLGLCKVEEKWLVVPLTIGDAAKHRRVIRPSGADRRIKGYGASKPTGLLGDQ